MRAIFLDIDGVLNNHEKLETGYCGMCRYKVSLFNKVLEKTDAKVIVSSAWRYLVHRGDCTLKGLEYLFLVFGVRLEGRLLDVTERDPQVYDHNHFDLEWWHQMGLLWRPHQIKKKIEEYGIKQYAVIDDLPLAIPNLIKTESKIGFLPQHIRPTLEVLGHVD